MASDFSSLASAEIVAACGTLGSYDKRNYLKDPDCLESLKDLVRFLKNDDESHSIRRQLAEIRVLQTDLLPLLRNYSSDKSIFDVNLRLLINLMNPALLLYHEELPEEKITRNYYLSIISHQQEYKQAFADPQIWKALSEKLRKLMKLDWEHRQEEDRLTIERILILIRNILHVPVDSTAERRTDDDVNIHDQIVWAFHVSGIDDLIIYLATTNEEQHFCFHVLEILFLLLREQNPQQLAQAGKERCSTEKKKDELELLEIRKQELEARKSKFQLQASRHSRFGGTFVLKDKKSISDREVICHQQLKDINNMKFSQDKEVKRKPKNRRPMEHSLINRRSTLSIRLFLQDFCAEFLKAAYNPFMNLIKSHLMGSNTQANDETYYLWAMHFFMEFNRLHYHCINLVTETMSISAFHYIQMRLDNYYQIILSDKKKISGCSKRMHVALKAYQELLLSLTSMDGSNDTEIRDSAKILKGNIFYVTEYREVLLTLLLNYDELKFSRIYLKDLIETAHIFVKMLEKYCKQQSHLVVEERKIRKKSKKKKKAIKKQTSVEKNNEEIEILWNSLSADLSEALQENSNINTNVVPFDAASDVEIDEQRIGVISRIKASLQERNVGEAVSLLRAAREIWPEDNVFGTSRITSENELMILKEIFFATMPAPSEPVVSMEIMRNTEMEDDETDEEEEHVVHTSEKEFGFNDFIQRFACKKIVQAYSKLLANYDKNSSYTNRCILRMLHHIAVDCKMYGLLFQASIFQTFQRILSNPMPSLEEKELSRLAKFVLNKFFVIANNNNKIFVELLFWKKPQEAIELEEGYEKQTKNRGPSKQCWTEEEMEELQTLHDEYKEKNGAIDKGVIDYIMNHLINQLKTRKQVIRQLKHQNIIESVQHLPKVKAKLRQKDKKTVTSEENFLQEWDNHENSLVLKQKDCTKKSFTSKTQHNRSKVKKKPRHHPDQQFQEPELLDTVNSDDDEERLDSIHGEILLAEDSCMAFFKEGLIWLKESMQEAADDEEDDDSEAVPVVPITNKHYTLLENNDFLKLMKALGFVPPAREQETFWRIPVHLTREQLSIRAEMLDTSLKRQLSMTEKQDDINTFALSHIESLEEKETNKKEDEVVLSGSTHSPDDSSRWLEEDNKEGTNTTAEKFENDTDTDDEQPKKRIKIRCIESDED